MKGFFILLGVSAMLVLVAVSSYNGIISKDEAVSEKFGTVQSTLQRRNDLIPNLVSTVQGYAKHEKEVFAEVAAARASVGQLPKVSATELANNPELQEQLFAAQNQMSSALSRLLAVAEAYPELKASENFRDLQAQLEGTENRINVARIDVQKAVKAYNTSVRGVPGVFIAKFMGFEPKDEYFEASEGADVAPVVSFDS